MAIGIGIDSPVKMSVYHATRSAKGHYVRLPGSPVGVVAVKPKETKNDYNYLILFFTVSPFRQDLNKVLKQSKQKESFSPYAQSLLDSCFKNWD